MLLASVADIRESLGFDDMDDINAAITAALHAAEPVLSSWLGTPFDAGTFTDTFYVFVPPYTIGDHAETSFRLSRGFVSDITSVAMASGVSDFAVSGGFIDQASFMQANLEKGVVVDYQTIYDRAYVRFVYTAGFDADGSDATSYDLSQVPAWLVQAATAQALLSLNGSPSLEQAQVTIDAPTLRMQLDALVRANRRYNPTALLPL
jgi:hypothetical protein